MLYEVVLQQRYFNQICINRWNYVGEGVPAAISPSLALLNAMGFIPDGGVYPTPSVFSRLRGLQMNVLTYLQVSARAIYDELDFFDTPFVQPAVGDFPNEGLAPFNAVGFFTNRVNQSIGRGYKRFAGVPEQFIGSGGVLVDTYLTAANQLAAEMSAVLTYDDSGNTLSFSPAIVQKEKYAVVGSDPVRYAYRYYTSPTTQTAHTVTGINWTPYPTVRSQTSRQYGRGQ